MITFLRHFIINIIFILIFSTAMSQDSTMTYICKNKKWIIEYVGNLNANRIAIRNGEPIYIDSQKNQITIDTTTLMTYTMEIVKDGRDVEPIVCVGSATPKFLFIFADKQKAKKVYFTK